MADEISSVSSQPGSDESRSGGSTQQSDRRAKNFEPKDDEKTAVKHWLQRVESAEKRPAMKEWEEQLETLRGYVAGTHHKDKTPGNNLVRTNMVYATIAAQMPELYAKNPTIEVKPTDAVGEQQMKMVKAFASTAERVIRKMLVDDGQLKKRAKANIRSTCGTSYGVLKATYQYEYRGDSVIIRRIQDTQDNLARIEGLVKTLKSIDDVNQQAIKRDELAANLKALQGRKEVKIYKGMAVDRVKSEDFLILDESVSEFDEYLEASALGQKIWMKVSDAKDLFGLEEIPGATRYFAPRPGDKKDEKDQADDDKYICVIEIWDRRNGVVRWTAKGANRWLREPQAPRCIGVRWYPFFVLGFNLIEGRWRPISDVELLMGLQDEYNDTRTNYADHRKHIVPVLVFRKGGNLTEEDITALTNRKNKDTIGVSGNPGVALSNDIMWFEGAKVDPAAYDVTLIRNDMDLVTGRSDASRANLIKPKTATEAEIMAESMQSRMSERRDTHEDLLTEMGQFTLEVMLQELTVEEVKQIAGPEAQWPGMPQSIEDIQSMVSVRVRAGSSGRPNQQKEREQWMTLMPIIKETMEGVATLRMNGQFDMANSTLELLRETLGRFEENLDLDSLIPPMEPGGPQEQMMQLQQQVLELRQQLEEQGVALQKAQEGEASAKQAEQAKVIEAQTKDRISQQEESRAQTQFENDQRRADDDAAHKRKLADDEMALRDRMETDKSARETRQGDQKLMNERDVSMERERLKSESGQADREAQDKVAKDRAAADQKFQQVLAALTKAIDALNATTAELADVGGSDRVPVYNDKGDVERVKVERKQKEKKKETVQ